MANPTKHDTAPPESMGRTPGVSPLRSTDPQPVSERVQQMGRPFSQGLIQTQDTKPADPILFADIEPGLLARAHPEVFIGKNSAAAEAAMEQGWQTHDEGWHLRANVDEDIEYDSGTLAPPTNQPASTIPQTAPSRPNEDGMHGRVTAAGDAFPIQQHADTTPQQGERRQASHPAQQPSGGEQTHPGVPQATTKKDDDDDDDDKNGKKKKSDK